MELFVRQLFFEYGSKYEPHKRTNKKYLQAQGDRKAQKCKLYPVGEPAVSAVVQKCCDERDGRNYQAYREALNCQYDKYGLVSSGCDYSKCKFLCDFCDDKKDKAEHDDVFEPHFFYG